MDYIEHQPTVAVETTLEKLGTGRVVIFVIGFVVLTAVLLIGVKPWKEGAWSNFLKYYVIIILALSLYAFAPIVVQTLRYMSGKPVLEDVPYEVYEDMQEQREEYERMEQERIRDEELDEQWKEYQAWLKENN